MSLGCPFISASVCSCYQTHEHNILKADELILTPVGTSCRWGNGKKQSTLGVSRSRSREVVDRFVPLGLQSFSSFLLVSCRSLRSVFLVMIMYYH